MEEKDPLKQLRKTDQELIHDIIDMELLDANEPIYIRRSDDYDETYLEKGTGRVC